MNIIVAGCKNKGIGFKNKLPWRLKNELKYFKNVTIGDGNNAIVMGKNTWLGLDKCLPKRDNYIISRTLAIDFHFKKIKPKKYHNMKVLSRPDMFNELLNKNSYDEIYVIGGEKLYSGVINNKLLNTIYYTNIHNEFDCDTFFPEIPPYFNQVFSSKIFTENNINYNFEIYINQNNENNFDVEKHKKFIDHNMDYQ